MIDNNASRRYRAAIIACGRISGAHGRGYQTNNVDIIACADIDKNALNSFGEKFGIPQKKRYLDYNEMMDSERPDIVSICSHHHLHALMTIDAAGYNPLAIFCEKPIALSLEEADAMIDACKKADTILIVGHQRRFAPQYVAAYKALKDGVIGKLLSIEAHGHPYTSLLVDGTHTVDLIRWYADDRPVEWVFGQIDASEKRFAWGSHVEDAAICIFTFDSGIRTILTLGGRTVLRDGKKQHEPLWKGVEGKNYHHIILRGTDGQIEIDGDSPAPERPWVRVVKNGSVEKLPLLELPAPHTEIVKLLLECMQTKAPHPLDASSARATLEILMAVYESSRRRSAIQLPLDVKENPLFEMLEREEI
jgi:predicted dehydrogenase